VILLTDRSAGHGAGQAQAASSVRPAPPSTKMPFLRRAGPPQAHRPQWGSSPTVAIQTSFNPSSSAGFPHRAPNPLALYSCSRPVHERDGRTGDLDEGAVMNLPTGNGNHATPLEIWRQHVAQVWADAGARVQNARRLMSASGELLARSKELLARSYALLQPRRSLWL
jgi:hypothetical protein